MSFCALVKSTVVCLVFAVGVLPAALRGQDSPAEARSGEGVMGWQAFDSPDKAYSVRLRVGPEVGSCECDRAEIAKNGVAIHEFSDVPGGYEMSSVLWSPDGKMAAIYTHDQFKGNVLVASVQNESCTVLKIPEFDLPAVSGVARNMEQWSRPLRWTSNSTLELGVCEPGQHHGGDDVSFNYDYIAKVHFDKSGNIRVELIKPIELAEKKI